LLVASAMSTLFAGLSSGLRNRAAAPLVSTVNVYVAVFGTRTYPINQLVSVIVVFNTIEASSVQDIVALLGGDGGLALDNVV
jgi:hypothetical protein